MSQISIIIPVHNSQEFLRRCLDSIQQQTFQDFEVILINDGSTDQSAEICEEYTQTDKRFKLINQENMGPSHARNIGIDKANSKYLAFVDSDDYIAPDMLENFHTAAEASFADLTICGFYYTNEAKECSAYHVKYDPGIYHGEALKAITAESLDLVAPGNIRPFSWIRFVRKECMEFPRLRFNTTVYRSEDYLIWNTLFARIKRLCLITDKPLYYYVTHQTSITHRYIENYWQMAKTIYNELKTLYAGDIFAEQQLRIMLLRRAYMSLNIASRAESKKQFYRDIKTVLKDKDLHFIIRQIPFKEGVSADSVRYLLLKFRLYFIVKLMCIFKYSKNSR